MSKNEWVEMPGIATKEAGIDNGLDGLDGLYVRATDPDGQDRIRSAVKRTMQMTEFAPSDVQSRRSWDYDVFFIPGRYRLQFLQELVMLGQRAW